MNSSIGNKEIMAKNLKFYIERSGKSQKELAELVGVAASTFNDWVKGKKYPRIDKIEILSNYFGILKSDLIEDKEEMHKKNDTLSDIIIKLRMNEDYLSLVEGIGKLNPEQFASIRQIVEVYLSQKGWCFFAAVEKQGQAVLHLQEVKGC